jgi:hypothetical protein
LVMRFGAFRASSHVHHVAIRVCAICSIFLR